MVVVRNTASHDARVLRCSKVLRSLGYATTVLAVTSDEEGTERTEVAGVPIVRLAPRAPRILRALESFAAKVASRSIRPAHAKERSGPDQAVAVDARATPSPGSDAPGGEEPDGGAPSSGLPERIYRLVATLDYYRQGIGAMRAMRPALVHCNDYNTVWIGVGAKLVAGSTLIYDSHELWPDRNGRREPRWWLMLCEALFVRVADRLLATSPGHAAEIARRYRVTPPQVIRNIPERGAPVDRSGRSAGGDVSDWEGAGDCAGRSGRDSDAVRGEGQWFRPIVYVGAVTSHRGLEQAIEALAHAPGVALRIVGPGRPEFRARLVKLAEEHRVGERVRVEQPVTPDSVVETIARGSCAGLALIQPSCLSYELSLPNKVFEYLAAGLPILASDLPVIGAFTEEHRCGLVVPPDDPVAIGRAMLEIADPERNRELRRAAEEAASRISWKREAEILERSYREAGGAPKIRGGQSPWPLSGRK